MPIDAPNDPGTRSSLTPEDKADSSSQRSNNGPRAKKPRVTGSGSRGVANLTPEQLEKKRANDREAQRAIRERTKNQIEGLERRIQELTSQQPYQELQLVLRQKEAIQAENDEIRKKLSSILAIIQPIIGPQATQSLNEFGGGHQQNLPLQGGPPFEQDTPRSFPTSTSTVSSLHSTLGTNSSASGAPAWQPSTSATTPGGQRVWSPSEVFEQQRSNMTQGLNLDASKERLGLGFLLESGQNVSKLGDGIPMQEASHMPFGSSLTTSSTGSGFRRPPDYSQAGQQGEQLLASNTLPVNCPPTCPLDSILLDFLAERRQRAAEGVPPKKLVGPTYPSVSSLLNPERSIYSHPLSKVFTDILATFPELSTLPERIGILYTMFLVMRWQVSPTQENYDRLPEWMTPRPSQLFTPHPAWIDHLPWPRMRDKMVQTQDYSIEDFFIPFTSTLSVNWPYEPTDALLSASESDELMINPVFERHLRNFSNWSLGPEFAKAFPHLANTVKIKANE
ncbi:MAG: hypothetical protein M1819_005642 [Sarea resinae]|nr:MAG: hypothetical protein M1819_005642 [Sarea resinae]